MKCVYIQNITATIITAKMSTEMRSFSIQHQHKAFLPGKKCSFLKIPLLGHSEDNALLLDMFFFPLGGFQFLTCLLFIVSYEWELAADFGFLHAVTR